MGSVTVGELELQLSELQRRRIRMDELWGTGGIDAPRYFAMRFFHGVETRVKSSCSAAASRAGYDFVKDTLQARTLARGHAYWLSQRDSTGMPEFSEAEWRRRGLGIPAEALFGFASLLGAAASDAATDAGVDAVTEIEEAFLRFVCLDASVRDTEGVSLGGEPDSAHFFSFAELAFTQVESQPESAFWRAALRGAVVAQPAYLAIHFAAGRRVPRTALDYGPGDVLHDSVELVRRLAAAPALEELGASGAGHLAELVGRNAAGGLTGLAGMGERLPVRVLRPLRSPARQPRPIATARDRARAATG